MTDYVRQLGLDTADDVGRIVLQAFREANQEYADRTDRVFDILKAIDYETDLSVVELTDKIRNILEGQNGPDEDEYPLATFGDDDNDFWSARDDDRDDDYGFN